MKLGKANKSDKKALTRRCVIPLGEADTRLLEDAQENLGRARLIGSPDGLEAARKHLDQITDEVGERGLEVVFRGIGRKRYDDLRLQDEYRPTDEQREIARGRNQVADWNPDTFGPALCHASAVDCDMTLEDWRELFASDEWGPSELAALFNAAVAANSDSKVVELGN